MPKITEIGHHMGQDQVFQKLGEIPIYLPDGNASLEMHLVQGRQELLKARNYHDI